MAGGLIVCFDDRPLAVGFVGEHNLLAPLGLDSLGEDAGEGKIADRRLKLELADPLHFDLPELAIAGRNGPDVGFRARPGDDDCHRSRDRS